MWRWWKHAIGVAFGVAFDVALGLWLSLGVLLRHRAVRFEIDRVSAATTDKMS
jgi:hypothetical protein